MTSSTRPFDFVIYGASGFTGQFVIEYVHRAALEHSLNWAVAGRSMAKLTGALRRAEGALGLDDGTLAQSIPTLTCDSSDPASLRAMASRAKVVLNCVGPYRFYGESVVEACLASGASHLDISGEPGFLEKMQLRYHEEARAKGVYVIGSCGFDSIPADCGQMYLRQQMGGDVHSIETYLEVNTPPDVGGATINFGTWQSAIYGFANAGKLGSIRKALYPDRMPRTTPKLKDRGSLHYSDRVGGWCIPFLGSDKSVMNRSQRYLFADNRDGHRPVQLGCYARISSLAYALLYMALGAIFGLMASFGFGRNLLEKFPGLFSLGAVSKKGPSLEMAQGTKFRLTLVGMGWNSGKQNGTDDKPDKEVVVRVSGQNIGYGATCECLVQAGLALLLEPGSLPQKGGVYPPGYAFAKTSITDKLTAKGVIFEQLSTKTIN